jgi:hypothetical protein
MRRTYIVCLFLCLATFSLSRSAQSQSYKESVLYSFTGMAGGWGPMAGVIRDSEGNLYGTTAYAAVYKVSKTRE